jgi:predicted transcriptional regulator
MARTCSPTSVSGQLRAILQRRPLSTREAAQMFGKSSAAMSAILNQLRHMGEARQLHAGTKGICGKPALWGGTQP